MPEILPGENMVYRRRLKTLKNFGSSQRVKHNIKIQRVRTKISEEGNNVPVAEDFEYWAKGSSTKVLPGRAPSRE
jgi:hypothetical protein